MDVPLFLIKQRQRDMWWACSSEHSTGWVPNQPKQAFSPSELTREVRRLIDQGWFEDLEILQLSVTPHRMDGPVNRPGRDANMAMPCELSEPKRPPAPILYPVRDT